VFLLPAESQRALFGRIGSALNPAGSFLFTSPAQPSTWDDALTGRQSVSLGSEVYRALLSDAALVVVREHLDEGGNHYYETVKR